MSIENYEPAVMNKLFISLFLGSACVVGIGVLMVYRSNGRMDGPPAQPRPAVLTSTPAMAPIATIAQESPQPAPERSFPAVAATMENGLSQTVPKPVSNSAPAQVVKKPKEPLKDPDARVALSMVGFDPDAEAYWYQAINNPELSSHERKDLIEDLNEEGFADPKHLTPDDLPLIVRRLDLLPELMQNPMDQTNFEAMQEAYKDLVNMYAAVTGGQ
jgi:hypothetical protein